MPVQCRPPKQAGLRSCLGPALKVNWTIWDHTIGPRQSGLIPGAKSSSALASRLCRMSTQPHLQQACHMHSRPGRHAWLVFSVDAREAAFQALGGDLNPTSHTFHYVGTFHRKGQGSAPGFNLCIDARESCVPGACGRLGIERLLRPVGGQHPEGGAGPVQAALAYDAAAVHAQLVQLHLHPGKLFRRPAFCTSSLVTSHIALESSTGKTGWSE